MPSLFISFSLYIAGFLTFGEPKITGSIQPVCIKTYVFRVYYRRRVEWPREHLEEERFTTCFDAFLIRKQIPHAIRYNVTVWLIRFPIASLFLFRLSMRIHSRVKVFSSRLVLSLSLSNSPENTLIPGRVIVAVALLIFRRNQSQVFHRTRESKDKEKHDNNPT